MSISNNLLQIKNTLPANVKLVAVSKMHPVAEILEAYYAGQKIFGENKVQELIDKYEQLPKDIEWHLIGHLQTNKVKFVVPFVSLIHSVDSYRLLQEINKEAAKKNKIVKCLLQIHIATEENKFGFDINEINTMLDDSNFVNQANVEICGVMGMATYTNNVERIKTEFDQLSAYFKTLKNQYFNYCAYFCEISMGMSGDYLLAIEHGSTMVRVGSSIFGERNY